MTHRGPLLLVALLLAACSPVLAPSPPPASAPPARLEIQPPLAGLPYDDPRLEPVIAALRAHPEWLDEPLAADPTVLSLVPAASEVCLALRGEGGDVHVTIHPSQPWSVVAVGIDRGDAGRELTYDPEELASDVCTFVAFGRRDAWPADAGAIEVTGSVDAELGRAVAEAVHAQPERFGIDRRGIPAVLVQELIEPAPDGWTCSDAGVFVGGPRARIVLGTRPTGDGRWEIQTRIVERALLDPEPRRTAHC